MAYIPVMVQYPIIRYLFVEYIMNIGSQIMSIARNNIYHSLSSTILRYKSRKSEKSAISSSIK